MLWVYIIAAVGLVGIMVETWLSYRKEAAQMQSETVHVRSGIRQNEAAATGIENKRHASDEHTAELKVETEKYTAEVELKRQELDAGALEQAPPGGSLRLRFSQDLSMDGLLILCLALLLTAAGLKLKTVVDLRRARREHSEVLLKRQRLQGARAQAQTALDRPKCRSGN